MVCSNCGYALGPEDQFCAGCGAFLTDAPAPEDAPVKAEASTVVPDEWANAYEAEAAQPPPRPSRLGGIIAGALVGLLLGALLIFWASQQDSDDAAGGPPTTSAPGTSTSTQTDSPSETPTESPTPTATQIEVPDSAAACSAVAGIGVQRGNDQTSCEFAENVARAYADLDQPVTETVTLEDVASPVTGQTYTLTCDFTSPVRCAGGNNAVIYLSPPS